MSVINKTNKNDKRSQKGRSMVEMLGVLAIVGVLSVGGVYGYGVAMKKHKANELLHQASMLATTISAQAMSNDGNLPQTITSFGNSSYGNFSTSVSDALDGKGFSITIENVDSGACTQLEKMAGGMVRDVDCDEATGDATITYYKNLATNPAEGEKSPTGGSSNSFNPNGPTGDEDGAECSGTRPGDCSVCLSTGESTGHWYDSDALCTRDGQICVDGTCVTSAADEPTAYTEPMCKCMEMGEKHYCGGDSETYELCSSDADCAKYGTWDDTQEKCVFETFCTNNSDCTSDEYCHYTSVDPDTCKPDKKGTCVKKADVKGYFASGTTAEEDGFIRNSGNTMDWFSAQNFCRSYGKNLVTLSQMDLGSAVPSGEYACQGYGTDPDGCQITADEWSEIQARFGSDFYWTANVIHSCGAFTVSFDYGTANVLARGRNDINYVLCK